MDASEQARLLQRMLDSKDKALMQHAGMCPVMCMSASVASSVCVLGWGGRRLCVWVLSTFLVCIVPPVTLTAARKRV